MGISGVALCRLALLIKIDFLRKDGLYYANLMLLKGTDYPIVKYGHMRRRYLQDYREVEYLRLLLNGDLNEHLHRVDVECE